MARENAPGYFLTFEGPDGSGKSTQAKLLAEYLVGLEYDILFTREPGGTDIGEQVRTVLHSLRSMEMQPRAEVLGYNMARAQLVGERIKPHLAKGGVVLCDRFYDNSLAYQGYGHMMDLGELRWIIGYATGGLKPDLTLLFDIAVEEGLGRRRGDGEWNRLDDMDKAFHERARKGYLEMASQEPERWVVMDATREIKVLQKEIECIAVAHLGIGKVK